MKEHTLRWRCASKSHDDFVATSREEYIEHMKVVHRSRLTDAQLRLLADKSSRASGQIFESCPLCGIEEPRFGMQEHVIGHLRLLAIKSLPAYDAEGSEDPENASAVESTTRRRSTPRDFTDANSNIDKISWGTPWGSIAGSDSSSATGGVYLSGKENQQHSGYAHEERHLTAGALSSQDDHGQSTSNTLEAFTPVMPRSENAPVVTSSPDPSCAICHQPAEVICECEARALETAVMQAETRMMHPIQGEIREWVRSHAENHVRTSFRRAASQITASAGEGTRAQSEVVEVEGDSSERTSADMKHRLNQLWCEAVQTYPETFDYFFSLVEGTLPENKGPAVHLSALAGSREKGRHVKQEGPETSEPSSQNYLPRLAPQRSLSQRFTRARASGDNTATGGQVENVEADEIDP